MPAVMCSSVRNEREAQTLSDKRGTRNASELYQPMIVRLGEEVIPRFGGASFSVTETLTMFLKGYCVGAQVAGATGN